MNKWCSTCKHLGIFGCANDCLSGNPNISPPSGYEKAESHPSIQDSGERRAFDSGAVRDIQAGKGRCDLLPLDVIAGLYDFEPLGDIAAFVADGDTDHLLAAARSFAVATSTDAMSVVLNLARHFEEGAVKYGERNWEHGIPTHCYIDSAVRHYLKHMRGDTDEPHDRAFLWNIVCCIWTMRHLPSLDDIPHRAT